MLSFTTSIWSTLEQAIAEDIGTGDVTTNALIPPDLKTTAVIMAKSDGIIAGLEVALNVFELVDPSLESIVLVPDGSKVTPGELIGQVSGSTASILKAERVALNFLQRLSGIATMTSLYVQAVADTDARIIDTRKTIPGLRELEKYAIRVGGGFNHRFNLSDGILIKDNHILALREAGLTISTIIELARDRSPHTLKVEIEVESIEEAKEALEGRADVILLDNMPSSVMKEVVDFVDGRCILEASGGVNLDTVADIAKTGVNLISVGALTHSAKAMDISLDIYNTR